MIPTGIPLGRKPPEHGAGALLCLEGNNLRSSIARAVNIPLECLLASVWSFLFWAKPPHFHTDSEEDGFGISPGVSVCGRQISSLWALKSQQDPRSPWHSPGHFSFHSLQIPSVLEQH